MLRSREIKQKSISASRKMGCNERRYNFTEAINTVIELGIVLSQLISYRFPAFLEDMACFQFTGNYQSRICSEVSGVTLHNKTVLVFLVQRKRK